jgi:hypothetical protein
MMKSAHIIINQNLWLDTTREEHNQEYVLKLISEFYIKVIKKIKSFLNKKRNQFPIEEYNIRTLLNRFKNLLEKNLKFNNETQPEEWVNWYGYILYKRLTDKFDERIDLGLPALFNFAVGHQLYHSYAELFRKNSYRFNNQAQDLLEETLKEVTCIIREYSPFRIEIKS